VGHVCMNAGRKESGLWHVPAEREEREDLAVSDDDGEAAAPQATAAAGRGSFFVVCTLHFPVSCADVRTTLTTQNETLQHYMYSLPRIASAPSKRAATQSAFNRDCL
jgi:hypothetical protein